MCGEMTILNIIFLINHGHMKISCENGSLYIHAVIYNSISLVYVRFCCCKIRT